ncbi:hypothetical protein ILYODFUR_000003 [Ilyodon furcidens]|uniref:Uncharacterized protein n=1 Tax=Ilyodon furcidens TaxID=33524 RepID=A0ABV0SJ12_9TELE
MQPALLHLSVCLKWFSAPYLLVLEEDIGSDPVLVTFLACSSDATKAGCRSSSGSSKHQQMNLPTLQRESNKPPHSISLTIPWFKGFREVPETYLIRSENLLRRDPPTLFPPLVDSYSSLCKQTTPLLNLHHSMKATKLTTFSSCAADSCPDPDDLFLIK